MRPAAPPPSPPTSRQGEDWLEQIAQSIDEMLWVWDPATGQVTHSNPAFTRFWGFEPLGQRGAQVFLNQVHADDRARVAQGREARAQTDAPAWADEYRVVQPPRPQDLVLQSRTAWLRENAFAVRGPAGQVRIVHIARDVTWQLDTTARLRAEITRRTDAERNLSDATVRLQTLIATANDAVVTIDAQSRIIDWNDAAERMFGWSREEVLGHLLTDLVIPAEHRPQHNAGIERFLADGSAPIFNRRVETTALRRSGETFDAELSVWPVRTGDHYTFSSFIRDISRRKAAERALAESEAKYRTVVENVNEGILVTAAGRILYANPRALALTGLDEETAKSRPFIEFIHADDRDLVLGNHLRRLRGEQVENHYQFRVIHTDGDIRWLEISAVVFDWQGTPATLNFLTDVTLRRQTEQDMRSALERERELSELKSRFVAVASHEFRTPLAAILSSVELLDDYGERLPADERKEMLSMIKTGVARMNDMVDQVLLTSRLEAGRFSFSPSPQRMPDLLVQIAAEMDSAHPQASRIAMDCDGVDAPRQVDSQLLRHILMNLLNNALKYSPPESAVTCSIRANGDCLHLRVADRGIGIPPADLPRLFESFHRGTNVGNIQGTGIGLHIVKECVALHSGTVDVDSQPGQGTTFHVRLHAPAA
ncbi:MAG: PAS domain S-box protein [Ramlibacter sp.]|nr:PAS domain S-box protein [Ramlibacter sp.]